LMCRFRIGCSYQAEAAPESSNVKPFPEHVPYIFAFMGVPCFDGAANSIIG
jgi:hypothetical protein